MTHLAALLVGLCLGLLISLLVRRTRDRRSDRKLPLTLPLAASDVRSVRREEAPTSSTPGWARQPPPAGPPVWSEGPAESSVVPLPVTTGPEGLQLWDLRGLGPPRVGVRLPPHLAAAPQAVTALEAIAPVGLVRTDEGFVLIANALEREVAPGERIIDIEVEA